MTRPSTISRRWRILVRRETGLLAHVNPGVLTADELLTLRQVSVSQGLMLESTSRRLCEKGGPHHGSVDKEPSRRIASIEAAGKLAIPFTTGILIGIGETRRDRVESLLTIRALHERYGHIQEVIIQNFRAKPDTRMATAREVTFEDLLWTAAAARLLLGPEMSIQVPPNLSDDRFGSLLDAGINDWGGVSPVTPDHVNPEAPWPSVEKLRFETEKRGHVLVPRLAIYPRMLKESERWLDPRLRTDVLRKVDSEGCGRDSTWSPGQAAACPGLPSRGSGFGRTLDAVLSRAAGGRGLVETEIAALFSARGGWAGDIVAAADDLRRKANGDIVSYVVNRNINYTNVCIYHCGFCAFSKGRTGEALRGKSYDITLEEVSRRSLEAWDRGATEVCMQGGINPHYSGHTYLDLLKAAKAGATGIHVHAFSPLEVSHGASTLSVPVSDFLGMLKDGGLGSLPGTAAEILDDSARAILCPDKLSAAEWLAVVAAAHRRGIRTTATIMFGHVDTAQMWARHLISIRDLQDQTGGFTEFVPLPFVHMESPLYLRGGARRGPTWREVVLMHSVARLALHPVLSNIQASWVKLGRDGVRKLLNAGVNDLGGTLMNESISRSAGTEHGQELAPIEMEQLVVSAARTPRQRSTLYAQAAHERRQASFAAACLRETHIQPFAKKELVP